MSDQMIIQSHKGPYEVHFRKDAIDNMADLLPESGVVLIDAHVADLYQDRIGTVLAGWPVIRIDAKETNKSLEAMPGYVDQLVDAQLRRDQCIVAIGGGIIQDITCFLASTLLRGVEWQFFPTTLLAQADSCIGSKSSINSGSTKNILGTFNPARKIYICTDFLKTLDERDLRSGIGEILKAHAIAGPRAFDALAAEYDGLLERGPVLEKWIRSSLDIKKEYIEEDEFDQARRNIFNYGHSFGHAIESVTNYAVPHGIAVTMGMDMANHVAASLGVAGDDQFRRTHSTFRTNYAGFETVEVDVDAMRRAMSKDKKNIGRNSVTLILPGRDGTLFRAPYDNDDRFADACRSFLREGRAA